MTGVRHHLARLRWRLASLVSPEMAAACDDYSSLVAHATDGRMSARCDYDLAQVKAIVDEVGQATYEAGRQDILSVQSSRIPRVIIESPFAGDIDANVEYTRACVRDSLRRGEAPFASHLIYTQAGILDDRAPDEREQGIEAGLEWGRAADRCAVYIDRGVSPGMEAAIKRHRARGVLVMFRRLEAHADASRQSKGEPSCRR